MARRFEFRLEAVRTVRRQTRDTQRRVVGEAARAVAGARERIARLNRYLDGAADEVRALQQPGRLDMGALKGHQLHCNSLNRAIEHTTADLAAKREELTRRQAELDEAAKRLKVIEKLRDKQWARHRVEVAREEQQRTDEAALEMFRRRKAVETGIGTTP